MYNSPICNVEGCDKPRSKTARCDEHRREQSRINNQKWTQKNPEKVLESRKRYYQNNKEELLANAKQYRNKNHAQILEMHRAWREANEGHIYETPDGYVKYIGYKHPAATASGLTNYHRIVLWDKLNGQDAMCHWNCGKKVYWSKKHPFDSDALVADHVNGIKNDNRPENLVPSCHSCNVTREGVKAGPPKTQVGECEFEGCDKEQVSLHLCGTHFNQKNAGKELTPIRKRLWSTEVDGKKFCTCCEEYKDVDNFYVRNGKRNSQCKECFKKRAAANQAARLARNIPCKTEGCQSASMTKGYCSRHYFQVWSNNNNNNGKGTN